MKSSIRKSTKPKTKFQDPPDSEGSHNPEQTNSERQGISTTRFRPGTPAPSKNSSPGKGYTRTGPQPMSLGLLESENDLEDKPEDISQPSPNPSASVDTGVWVRVRAETMASDFSNLDLNKGLISGHLQNMENLEKPKHESDGRRIALSDLLPTTTISHGVHTLFGHSASSAGVQHRPVGHLSAPFSKDMIVQPAVLKGTMFIPSHTRPRPAVNSFGETHDLGPSEALKRWLIDMENFRDDEISFTLNGLSLKVEGKQSTRSGKIRISSETISLPPNFDMESLKAFRNRQIGTLIIAHLPIS